MLPRAISSLPGTPGAWLLASAAVGLAGCQPSREQRIAEHEATLARYCTSCHDDVERTAKAALRNWYAEFVATGDCRMRTGVTERDAALEFDWSRLGVRYSQLIALVSGLALDSGSTRSPSP